MIVTAELALMESELQNLVIRAKRRSDAARLEAQELRIRLRAELDELSESRMALRRYRAEMDWTVRTARSALAETRALLGRSTH